MNLVRTWWDWCSESLGHTFAGVTAPLLVVAAFIVVVFFANTGGDDGSPQPPRSDVAGICVTATPGSDALVTCGTTVAPDSLLVSTATPVPPTPTPAPRKYTVKAGDALSLICSNEVPNLEMDACIDAIVKLSGLGGPNEIFEGQVLELPPSSGTSATSTRRTTTTTTTSVAPTATAVIVEPTPTEEPVTEAEPTPAASLVAIDPTAEPAEEDATTEPETTPTDEDLAATEGTEYTVQSGDSLLGICVAEEPNMNEDDCIEFVVLLNDLDGPDQIYEGQVLVLP